MASKQDLGATGDVAGLPATSKSKRDKIDPMRIAWLLRADLRRGAPAGGPISDWFKLWWLVNGPREYPAWTDHAALREAGLFRPLPDWPSHGGFGMTPALQLLIETREDLARTFDVTTDDGLWSAIAWLFVHGVREYRLASALDEHTLAALDTVPPFFADEAGNSDTPEITWLMFFVWRSSADLQKHLDLRRAQDRKTYLTWFLLNGVPQLKLAPLLAPRWHAWLREPVLENRAKAVVPRAAYLLWQRHEQLQRAFRLETEQGIDALAMWAAEVWSTQAELSWIDQPVEQAAKRMTEMKERPFGVNLIGFAFGELGIGEDVRMAVAACEAAGIPFTVVNIHPGDTLRQADQALAEHVAKYSEQGDHAPYAFNLFCLTAFDTARVFLEQGNSLFEGRHNIGWWPWELPVWPQDWLVVFDLVDEVWAATTFTYRMYTAAAVLAPSAPVPVNLMPMAVTIDRTKQMSRDELGLPRDKFLFLYVFDFNSYLTRKNPLASVKAFRKAFNLSEDSVCLVLKTMNADASTLTWKRFVRACSKDSRIIILNYTMERSEVLGLVQSCDAYISPHRAEGFGRTLAEAMLFGKPVIGTAFSGPADFLHPSIGYPVSWKRKSLKLFEYPFISEVDHAWWASPNIADMAAKMHTARHAAHTPEFAERIREAARTTFSPHRIGRLINQALHKIIQKDQKFDIADTSDCAIR